MRADPLLLAICTLVLLPVSSAGIPLLFLPGARELIGYMDYPTKSTPQFGRLVGGYPVETKNYIENYIKRHNLFVRMPFMAMVSLRNVNDSHICGGTLISPHIVLSAAHCFDETNTEGIPVTVDIGRIRRVGPDRFFKQKQLIQSFVIHEGYSKRRNHDNDAALVLLETGTEFPTVELAKSADCFERFRNCDLQVLGWGKLDFDKGLADFLQIASPPIVMRVDCQEYLRRQIITENMLCAGNPLGGIGPCSGDSGGPALVFEDGIYRQVGIVSWSFGCGDYGTPQVFTSIPEIRPWIMSYLDSPERFPISTS